MNRQPILTWTQFNPAERQNGPVPFLSNIMGELALLQGELEWRVFDFCRIHQIVYKEISTIEKGLDEIPPEYYSMGSGDEESILKSRIRESINAQDIENNRVISFVDHITIVGLWAIAEQFLGKIYTSLSSRINNVPESSVQAPYKWDDFKREFRNYGIDLTTCENFLNANECRVLNNSIKHSPVVNTKLIRFPYFSSLLGKKLEDVPLEMQRYLNGVSDYLGSLIEKSNERLRVFRSHGAV